MTEPHVERIVVDLRENRLLLDLDRPLPQAGWAVVTIDIGALGRLIGIEVFGLYLSISDPIAGSELQGRSVEAGADVQEDLRRLVIPRRGPGWELSYPSGNQCWNRTGSNGDTLTVCSILASA